MSINANNTFETTVETYQERFNRENFATCKSIAEEIESYVNGNIRRCPECGESTRRNEWDFVGNKFKCPHCGEVSDTDDFEKLDIYNYLEDGVYDIEYRHGRDASDLRSVQIMIAGGGPNIYIDTKTRAVELYWGTSHTEYPISYDAAEAIDDWAVCMWT